MYKNGKVVDTPVRSDQDVSVDSDIKLGVEVNDNELALLEQAHLTGKTVKEDNPAVVNEIEIPSIPTLNTTLTPSNSPIPNTDANKLTSGDPWDKRLYRLNAQGGEYNDVIPYSVKFQDTATFGYYTDKEQYAKLASSNPNDSSGSWEDNVKPKIQEMKNDPLYKGVPAIMNPYALITLYGSNGGEMLVDKKNTRAWYEVDSPYGKELNYSKNPTTSSIISWGNGDPYDRTPYQFSDFVFSKYWNKIPNNRLITLRRFPAPIVDNMNFPGMDGVQESKAEGGAASSKGKGSLAPMATAITYIGEETGNKLSDILKFTTGYKWTETNSAEMWKPEIQGGQRGNDAIHNVWGLEGIMTKLNILGGDMNFNAAMAKGNVPPDPYSDGPFENKIKGPINRIDKVKKREPGLEFKMDGLKLTFEYVASPIGGANTKAVMLDIISNFLVMSTSNAIFFGGGYRFLSRPAAYPFIGGDSGMHNWYSGNAVGWADNAVTQLVRSGANVWSGLSDMFSKLINSIKNMDFSNFLSDLGNGASGGLLKNATNGYLAERTTQAIPYMTGMRALLIGEPVGEWHLTVGNPLNPIALIGNLVCKNVEITLGDELGPDDFPTEVKMVVTLDHGMDRDKDAIQSMFNRGYGRIYSLPDKFKGSSDYETAVDKHTLDKSVGSAAHGSWSHGQFIGDGGKALGASSVVSIKPNYMHTAPSVWNRMSFHSVSMNDISDFNQASTGNRTTYRNLRWIAESALR